MIPIYPYITTKVACALPARRYGRSKIRLAARPPRCRHGGFCTSRGPFESGLEYIYLLVLCEYMYMYAHIHIGSKAICTRIHGNI